MAAAKRASLAAALLQQAPRRRGVLRLQPLAQPLLAFAVTVEPRTGGAMPVTGAGNVHDAQIHTRKSVDGFALRGFRCLDRGVEKPLADSVHQIGFTDRAGAERNQIPFSLPAPEFF